MARRLILLLGCALLVAGCGSSKDESVDGLLKDTFAGGKSVKSGRLAVQLDANLQGVKSLKGPVRLKLDGPFQSTGKAELPKFDFTLAITSNGQTFTAGGTSLGDKGFVSFQSQAYSVSDKLFQQFKQGYLQAQSQSKKKSSAPTLGSLGIDPRRWLTGARKAGETDVEGAKTVHVTAGVNTARLLADVNRVLARASSVTGANKNVPTSITPAQQKQIEDAVQNARVDVYTGKDDHALRKLDVGVTLKKSGTLQGGTLNFTLTIADLNEDQTIVAPKNAQPLDQLLAQLQGGTASSATGSSGTATTPTTPAPSSSAGGGSGSDQYLQCLQDAGQDIPKVQKCAALLK
jgi:hypothetical protein